MKCPNCSESTYTKCSSTINHVQHFRCSACGTIYDKAQALAAERARNKPKPEKFRGERAGSWYRAEFRELNRNEREVESLAMTIRRAG